MNQGTQVNMLGLIPDDSYTAMIYSQEHMGGWVQHGPCGDPVNRPAFLDYSILAT